MDQDDVRREFVREIEKMKKAVLVKDQKPEPIGKKKLRAEKRKLAAEKWRLRLKGGKRKGRKQPKLHFRWKRVRLTLCLGGTEIAAWPGADDGHIRALMQTHMIGEHLEPLSHDQRRIRALALRLREALVKAEEGPRSASAARQRARIDQLFRLGVYRPIPTKRGKNDPSDLPKELRSYKPR